ncbi:MAG: GC-type dockerin domain-anchored protein, partial [Planctomycetota bacterium]
QSSSLPDGGGSLLDGGDVSIHVLNSSVPANIAVPMRLIDETTGLVGQTCATLGYGWNGLGSSGHGFSADGLRWGGENVIDVYGSPASAGGANIISTDFDNPAGTTNTIPSSSAVALQFEATTAPGDSGGPVLVQFGGEWVIAGVLSGGTTNTSVYGDISWWTGTALYRDDIESAGGEFATGLEILFPDGLPEQVSSSGGETLRVDIVPSPTDPIVPGSGTFHVDSGSGFQQIALIADSATSFTATFPAPDDCPTNVEYFVSFDLQSGVTLTAPADASTFSVLAADQVDMLDLYDFESPVGFSAGAPGDDATTGVWVRVDPNGTEAQPENDNTVDGAFAWVTGQGTPGGATGENDVDNGTTSLVSNQIDLSGVQTASISYARWYSNNTGQAPNADVFEVFVSDDDGQTYVLAETVGPAGDGTSGGWIEAGFVVNDFVNLTSTIRVKFVASDLVAGSLVEAGVDDVRIFGISCTLTDACAFADITATSDCAPGSGDGVIDLSDFSCYLAEWSVASPFADITLTSNCDVIAGGGDGVDLSDFSCYLAEWSQGCP